MQLEHGHVYRSDEFSIATARVAVNDHRANLYIAPDPFDCRVLGRAGLIAESIHVDLPFQYHFYGREDTGSVGREVHDSLLTNSLVVSEFACEIGQRVQMLTRFMAELGDCSTPFVSLRTVDESYVGGCVCGSCNICIGRPPSVSRDWHVDSTRLTLASTLVGAQTEYTLNKNVNRVYFIDNKIMQPRDDIRLGLVDPGEVYPIPKGSIGILKGEIRQNESPEARAFYDELGLPTELIPFNEGNGLVHRGPKLKKGDKRLTLTVSTH